MTTIHGYEVGLAEAFWKPVREYWQEQTPHTEAAVREALTLDAIRWQYLHGVGALAFADDAPDAEICLLDGGHFLLESQLDTATNAIRGFLDKTVAGHNAMLNRS